MPAKPRFMDTTRKRAVLADPDEPAEPVVVLAHHPRLARIGEWFPLRSRITEVSRLAPSLHAPDGVPAGPLDDPYLSRQAFELSRLPGDGAIEVINPNGVEVAVDGTPLAAGATVRLGAAALKHGVELVVGDRVVLWLTTDHHLEDADDLGMFGRSGAMRTLRAEVTAAAMAGGAVLVLGETGAGKELVAHALHAAGPRAHGPFVAVNVAAIPSAVAAAELFGHERGAFTGAGERRAGYFERAAGGVLFLDEIGELPEAIQPVMLRALESGEIQPVGGNPRKVDVAVVAATDVDLEAAVAAGRFRGPLFYRLAATTIRVPPLRQRGVDAALLLSRFLLEILPPTLSDHTTHLQPWLPATLAAALARRSWPGNVRELRNVAIRLAAVARAGRTADPRDLGPAFALEDAEQDAAAAYEASAPAPGGPIDDDRLIAALREHKFQLNRTADALGISRTHLDALIARSGRIRKAKDLDEAEILAVAAELRGDLDAMAARLEVSARGLRLRMRQLGM